MATGFPGVGGKAILDSLNVQGYYEYYWGPSIPGAERLQMVARRNISEYGLDDFIRSNPGQLWQIGNEPNVPNQDNLTPAEFARQHYYWSRRIKSIDPTAKILNGGIVNWPDVVKSGTALDYIKQFRDSYRSMYGEYPPIDIWSIHAFPPFYSGEDKLHSICDTTEPKRFIAAAVQYLRSEGENQPIWLTEFGMDWGDDPDPCQVRFMIDMVDWLRNTRLVDRWYWFSTNAWRDGKGGALVNLDGSLTDLGVTYRNLASGRQ